LGAYGCCVSGECDGILTHYVLRRETAETSFELASPRAQGGKQKAGAVGCRRPWSSHLARPSGVDPRVCQGNLNSLYFIGVCLEENCKYLLSSPSARERPSSHCCTSPPLGNRAMPRLLLMPSLLLAQAQSHERVGARSGMMRFLSVHSRLCFSILLSEEKLKSQRYQQLPEPPSGSGRKDL
jgi:hypothetical protein